MNKRNAITALVIVAILVILLTFLNKSYKGLDKLNVKTSDKISLNETPQSSTDLNRSVVDIPDLAASLNSKSTTVEQDLRIISDMLSAYRTNFPNKGNPTGTNEEITLSLSGKNKLGLILISRNNPAINSAGELCDRWGTPYFFHAESGLKMKIRSAGPDKKMWTKDDLEFEP
jgi:hypothetical protein